MKFTLSWLKDHLDTKASLDELTTTLSAIGLEVTNRKLFWFVTYCFVFRMFYALTLIRIVISFAWIWTKIRAARQSYKSIDSGTR